MVVIDTALDKRKYRSFYWRDSLSFANWKFDAVLAFALIFFADMALKFAEGNWPNAILQGCVAVIALLWFFLERKSTLKKHLKLLDIPLYKNKTPMKFEVTPKKIVSQNKKNGKMEAIKWAQIRKVVQNKKYWFAYVDKHSAMIIAKADIKEGSAAEFDSYWKAEQQRRAQRKNATKVIEG